MNKGFFFAFIMFMIGLLVEVYGFFVMPDAPDWVLIFGLFLWFMAGWFIFLSAEQPGPAQHEPPRKSYKRPDRYTGGWW